jgi:hypothetical protein
MATRSSSCTPTSWGRTPAPLSCKFNFLGGSRPERIDHKTRFYAWASVSVNGDVVAWDYAPDVGWLSSVRPD